MIQGRLLEGDYVSAQFLHVRPNRVTTVVIATLAVLVYVPRLWTGEYGLIVLSTVLAAGFFLFVPYKSRRDFRQFKALSELTTVELRSEGLHFKRVNGEGMVPWSEIRKWRCNDDIVLLYPASVAYYIIPGHFFDNGKMFKEFKQTLHEKLGPGS